MKKLLAIILLTIFSLPVGVDAIYFANNGTITFPTLPASAYAGNPRSIAFWVRSFTWSHDSPNDPIIRYTTGTACRLMIVYLEDNTIAVGYNGYRIIATKNVLATSTWAHIAVVNPNNVAQNTLIYINGQLQSTSTESGAPCTINLASAALLISADGANRCDCEVAYVSTYDRALLASEVKHMYLFGDIPRTNLQFFAPLYSLASGLFIPELSHKLHGTLAGTGLILGLPPGGRYRR